MTSDSPQVALYPDLSALTEVYLIVRAVREPPLQGQLWTHYSREFGKYSHELNGRGGSRTAPTRQRI